MISIIRMIYTLFYPNDSCECILLFIPFPKNKYINIKTNKQKNRKKLIGKDFSSRANLKAPFYFSSHSCNFPFLPLTCTLAHTHTHGILLAVAPQQSLAGSLLQHRFKPKPSIFTFGKLYKHSEISQSAVYGTCLRKVRGTLYLLGKGDKEKHK